jgi:phosphate transport system permease protein
MFSWLSRPSEAFHVNAAAAGVIIILVTLLMNGFAIRMRYKMRQNIKW